MGRSDDSISRRRNKKSRKKQENKRDSSSKVSARVAAIIAAKKRRQSGKRRNCQGMCFSLPTPEDPFNDKQGKIEPTKKRKRNSKASSKLVDKSGGGLKKGSFKDNDADEDLKEHKVMESVNVEKGKLALVSSISFMGPEIAINLGKATCQMVKRDGSNHSWKEFGSENNTDCPSKFLIMCLNSIQNALENGGALSSEGEKPLFANAWGLEFWNCYSTGKDVLETTGAGATVEQIAWMASTAADTISMKEKEGLSLSGPSLLYLVPSQEKASKVRQVCKPLKTLGILTVSLHSGASIDHQTNGLKSCEPEFLVSTPERLLELLSLKAVDISGVSLLVIDGLEAPFKGAYFDAVKSIRQFIPEKLQTVVFCDCMNNSSISVVQKLAGGSICK
ncbi:putative ATP-dependent RNA helicase ddx5 [Sesamum alatum]|uniref:ATP-dependent RNA helicase ddx5 n=1 Tax=Sesamum alatum TaxID=300844 RepID=A0AAE1YSY3_9LAMI|nr:putative ATP-dependent RNA helicase ddx5 [Sesamum alatum]